MKKMLLILLCISLSSNGMQPALSKEEATKGLMRVMQEAIAQVDRGSLPLTYKNNYNPVPQIEKFLNAGANINAVDANGNTPLSNAIWLEDVRLVILLLKKGADVNQIFPHAKGDTTALNIAISRQNSPIVRFLLKAGADPNVGTYLGRSPLEAAIVHSDSEIVQMLIGAGTNINAKFPDSLRTPLMLAINHEESQIAQILIAAGADLDAQDNEGNTPLHLAVTKHDKLVVSALLEQRANRLIKNKDSKTALDIAQEQGDTELINLFNLQKIP